MRQLFLKIAQLFHDEQEDLRTDPYNLTEGRRKRLRSLTKQEGWNDFVEVLDNHSILVGERLLGAEEPSRYNFLRGKILGLRESVLLIDKILAEEDIEDARKRQRELDAEQRGRSLRAATYGSSAYRGDKRS